MAIKAGLAIIDFQEDFCEPHGSLAVKGGRECADTINALLDLPFELKIATRDWHPEDHISFASQHEGAEAFTSHYDNTNFENPEEKVRSRLWPEHCVQGTKGAELVPELHQSKLTHVIDKGQDKRVESYSAFGPPFSNPPICRSGLAKILKDSGIQKLFVVGLALDYCVKASAIDAAKQGFETFVIEEGCNSVDTSEEGRNATKRELEEAGVKLIGLDSKEVEAMKKG